MKTLLFLPGDGIGPEVCAAALPVLDQLNLPLHIKFGDIGWKCWEREGRSIPDETWIQIQESDAVVLGTVTNKGKRAAEEALPSHLKKISQPYISPVIQLRQHLDLFANIRPIWHIASHHKPFRCCIIRENTEGLYAGLDYEGIPEPLRDFVDHPNLERSGGQDASITLRLQTRFGLTRLFHHSFNYARNKNYTRVTLVDKPYILRESGQFAADIFYEIASDYPEIQADIQNVDAVALRLQTHPESFGVIVAENMFGDILSDLAAGLMGGVGLAASINQGESFSYFEPVHGSAHQLEGHNRANPSGFFLTLALALHSLDYAEAAERIENAVRVIVQNSQYVTYDLGGQSTTQEMAQAIISEVMHPRSQRRVSFLYVGDELLRGDYMNTNAKDFAQKFNEKGYTSSLQIVSPDRAARIQDSLVSCFAHSDMIVVNGGLGPTSDDVTREAIAQALDLPLQFNAEQWEHIKNRLKKFDLNIHPDQRKQAFFPETSVVLPNSQGTAAGFFIRWKEKDIYVLPGPPQECLPMLEAFLEHIPSYKKHKLYHWRLLGVVEATIAADVDRLLNFLQPHINVSYVWRYPYVDVRLTLDETISLPSKELESVEALFAPYLVSRDGHSAVEILIRHPEEKLILLDQMTNGELERRLPCDTEEGTIYVHAILDGNLEAPYDGTLDLSCHVEKGDLQRNYKLTIPKRGPEIIDYMCEFVAWSVLRAKSEMDA